MKIRFYLALAAAALVMTNCSQDEELVQVKQSTKGFTATIEGASRSDVTEAGVFSWTAGDEISVWNGTKFDVYANSKADVNTFVAEDEEAGTPTGYAIYPASEDHGFANGTLLVNLSATYTHGSTNAPMLATITEGSSTLAFKHLGGLMRFVVNNVPVGASSFVFTTTNNILTGGFGVNDGQITQPPAVVPVTDENNNVTISFDALEEVAESMVFFVPLPVGTYGEYTVAIKGDNLQDTYSHTSQNVTNTIGRCTMLLMPEFNVENGELKKGAGNTIPVTQEEAANLSGIQNVTIDTDNATEEDVLNINYTPSEGNAILNITDDSGETESQASVAKIKINPQGTTPIESLNLNTPTLTAELGAGTYGTVEALTANQTLIIAEGVTIETLILNGGALQVTEGATNVIIGEIIVKDALGVTSALTAGGKVTLAADITLTEMTTISKDLNLDLAGHTLTFEVAEPDFSWPCLKNTANTSIYTSVEGGKIVSNDVGVQNNGTLTINCDIESSSSAINNVYSGKVTIEGGSYSSTAGNPWALIAVNSWGEGTPEVIIEDGTFTSSFTNLSFNNGSKGTINGGTFTCTGGWHNIYAGGENGGCVVTYDESECTFTSNGQSIYVHDEGEENSVTSF